MKQSLRPKSRKGRPSKQLEGFSETRAVLIRAGLVLMTEKGFSNTGLDEILKSVSVPKGSFYHYFKSKEDFGAVLIDHYGDYFNRKLDRFLLDEKLLPLDRFQCLIANLRKNIIEFDFKRGCLIGNLGQEMGSLPPSFRQKLIDVFNEWENRTVVCFQTAQAQNQLSDHLDCHLMAKVFWTGWEGAVLRAKLERNAVPLDVFSNTFLKMIAA